MTTSVSRVRLSLVWCRPVTEALQSPFGTLTMAPDFRTAFSAKTIAGVSCEYPWVHSDARWSLFWSRYLGASARLRHPRDSEAWNRLVPLALPVPPLFAPGGVSLEIQVLGYPSAVIVAATVVVDGSWPIGDLANAVSDIRSANTFGTTPALNRSLDGIAGELADAAARHLVRDPSGIEDLGVEDPITVVAPVRAEGSSAELALDNAVVKSCIVGLASVGPPGQFDPARLLPSNSNTRLSAAIYTTSRGHVIWSPDGTLGTPPDAVTCLHRNQTSAIAQLLGLAAIIQWAGEDVEIPPEVRPVVSRAVFQLARLHAGASGTYRSGLLKQRIEPLLPTINALRTDAGLGVRPPT